MEYNPIVSPTKYHLRRAAKFAALLALVLAIKPAYAFITDTEATTEVVSGATSQASISATVGSIAPPPVFADVLPTDAEFPAITATSALVTELGAEKALLAYRTNARWPLASVSKLMSAVVAIEALGPSAIITVSKDAVATEGEAGGLKTGDKYSVIDLVRAMLVVSSNDAAVALAEAYDRKVLGAEAYSSAINHTAEFTAAMQRKARELGMSESYYGDSTGLSVISQSIVTDLATLMEYVVANDPTLLEITRKKEARIVERTTMTPRMLRNINEFAGQEDFLGGKTGRTDEAGGNLLSLFEYQGKKYLIVVLGTEDRFGETRALYEWVKTHAH